MMFQKGIVGRLNEIRKTFCGITQEKTERINAWEYNTLMKCIESKVPDLSNTDALTLSGLSMHALRNSARFLVRMSDIDKFQITKEKVIDKDTVMPSRVEITARDGNGEERHAAFYDDVKKMQADISVPLNIVNGELTANIFDEHLFDAIVDAIAEDEQPTVGYVMKEEGIFKSVSLSEVQSFVLPTGEDYSKGLLEECISQGKDAFMQAVYAHKLLRAFSIDDENQLIHVAEQLSNLYQVGIVDQCEELQDAMCVSMAGLCKGFFEEHTGYIYPSSYDVMESLLDGEQDIGIFELPDGYTVNIETNDIYIRYDEMENDEMNNCIEEEDISL